MSADVDLAGAAALLHRSYSWFLRNWRTLKHGATGAPFPRPYVGGERGSRPVWRKAAVIAWQDGQPAEAHTPAYPEQRAPAAVANDPAPRPPTDRAAALLQAAGG